jgi:trehalose-phosphatase
VPGRDKGFVVDTVLREMDTDTVAAYLGDDLTDEDAFKAINGRGLPVLVRGEFRPTAARCWLKPADELLAFLRRWQEACGGRK